MSAEKNTTGSKKLTLVDVGRTAGVSAITVSRVLNTPDKVSEALRERVQKAIHQLGYIPNSFASSLASARSRIIGVSVPSLSNAVFPEVLNGIYDVCTQAGYRVLLVNTHYSPLEEERTVQSLLSQAPEGLILTGGEQTQHCQKSIKRAGIPVVQMMALLDRPLDMNVGISHARAGAETAKYLYELGHRHIGFIGARMDARVQQRMEGFISALRSLNAFSPTLIQTTPEASSIAVGVELFRSLYYQKAGPLQALFCANDDLALGALFEAQRMNIQIPQQLAICGFNDVEAATYTNPSLSSVHIGRYTMGKLAAEMLLKKIRGETVSQNIVDVGFEIKARQSTMKLTV